MPIISKAKGSSAMPSDKRTKCHAIIHTAAVAAGAAGTSPLPGSDAIPIGMAQIAMVVSLGKVFDITIGESAAKAVIGIGVATQTGRFFVTNGLKFIPGVGTLAGMALGSATAFALTEALGWIVADDFYRISIGKSPQNLGEAGDTIIDHFNRQNKR